MPSRLCTAILALLWMLAPAGAEPVRITDILGREVTLEGPARRIVLGQGRYLPVIGLIEPDPVPLVVGWKEDMKRDIATYEAWRRRFPAVAAIPTVGGAADASFSVETAIALKPDVVVMSLFVGEVSDPRQMERMVGTLQAAGIPVVFVDFFNRPLEHSARSVRILGQVLGRREAAEAFASFYETRLARISERLRQAAPARPSVFMHAHAGGTPCCFTAARGVFDDLIAAAGGRNIARDRLPGATGQLSLEFIIGSNPDFYVPTGGAHLASRGGLVLGTGTGRETAQSTFERLISSPGIGQLGAVANGRAFGVWHMFNDSPINIVLVELLARRLHPALFADLDPAATLAEIGRRFSPVPIEGTYWYGD